MNTNLTILDIPLADIQPNPWNPNRQTERQFEAEVESIRANGFISPIIVRKQENHFEIVDGEHRYRAMNILSDEGDLSNKKLEPLLKKKSIPAVVLDITDGEAKKLTIIMNETRGKPNVAELSALLADLERDFGKDLITGLPYTAEHLNDLLSIGEFNWDDAKLPVTDDDFGGEDEVGSNEIRAVLDDDTYQRWNDYLSTMSDRLPSEPKEKAGAAIIALLNSLGA